MPPNKRTVLILTLLAIASLFSVAGALIWLGLQLRQNRSTPTATLAPSQTNTHSSSSEQVSVTSSRKVNYSKLQQYLQQKDWQAADKETYERLLEAAGPKAQAKGFTPQDEMDALSCNDLKTVDKLWRDASNGQLGFTAQEDILKALGDYKKMYAQVGWATTSGEPLIDWNYNPQTKRMEHKQGLEPNFKNPPPGHLPTVERNYNYDVALDGALKRCGF